jgi:membrane-associated phospholipid phosphatase
MDQVTNGATGGRIRRLRLAGFTLIVLFIILNISVNAGITQGFDISLFKVINSWSPSAQMDSTMIFLSVYGRDIVWGAAILILFLLWGEREKKTAITLVLVFLILAFLGYSLKAFDMRIRPYDVLDGVRLLIGEESDYGFPSGHTLIVFGGAAVVWLYLRKSYAIILTAEASLVSFSRVYVGVHFPTDVAGGVLLGVACALLVCSYPILIDSVYMMLPRRLKAA